LFRYSEPPGHAVQGRVMDWTVKDNMVDGLFYCTTSRTAEGTIPHLYKQQR